MLKFELEYRAYAVRMKAIRMALETGMYITVRRCYFLSPGDAYTVYMRENRTGEVTIAARVKRFYEDDDPIQTIVNKRDNGSIPDLVIKRKEDLYND